MSTPELIGLAVAGTLLVAYVVFVQRPLNLHIQAKASGVQISLIDLVRKRKGGADQSLIVYTSIRAKRLGIDLTPDDLLEHHLAGGDVTAAVDAMARVQELGLDLGWSDICAIDLAEEGGLGDVDRVLEQRQQAPGSEPSSLIS